MTFHVIIAFHVTIPHLGTFLLLHLMARRVTSRPCSGGFPPPHSVDRRAGSRVDAETIGLSTRKFHRRLRAQPRVDGLGNHPHMFRGSALEQLALKLVAGWCDFLDCRRVCEFTFRDSFARTCLHETKDIKSPAEIVAPDSCHMRIASLPLDLSGTPGRHLTQTRRDLTDLSPAAVRVTAWQIGYAH
jgi:hypothetical protein